MEYLILNLLIRIKLISKTVLHSDSRDMLPVRNIVRLNFFLLSGRGDHQRSEGRKYSTEQENRNKSDIA